MPDDPAQGALRALGGRIHDGRFATLMDVVDHDGTHLNLDLSDREKNDPAEYLECL